MVHARPRRLLICFDAFDTLITPRRPAPAQYGEVARQLGLTDLADADIKAAFKTAFGSMSAQHPNYGRDSDMGAEGWWTNVIHDTFRPLLRQRGQSVPPQLAPRLLHRFSSSEGYRLLEPELPALLRVLRSSQTSQSGLALKSANRPLGRIVVGVITNSDDRVPNVLSSLGIRVGPLRWKHDFARGPQPVSSEAVYDIDFCCMSYDVGREKPDAAIFRAAQSLGETAAGESASDDSEWTSLYVGDNHSHDVVGALNAGWHGVLLDGAGSRPELPELTASVSSLESLLARRSQGFRIGSIGTLVRWLLEKLSPA